MTRFSVAVIDVLYWPLVQIAISAVIVRVDASVFLHELPTANSQAIERNLRRYRRSGITRWKKLLPDAAFLVGGEPKRISPFNRTDIERFLGETRRAEAAHWAQLSCAIFCWLWNPAWAAVVMTLYALFSNFPCILAQRYNRSVLQKRLLMT